MKILVTGGAGFLGSHLCSALIKRGDQVICLDNFLTGRGRNIFDLLENDNFFFERHDVIDPLMDMGEIDQIYHLACPASPIHYRRDPIHTTKTNVYGAVNVLDAALTTGASVLLSSTSEVYGDPTVHPQHEEYYGNVNPIGIRSCYDEGKRCAESLFFDYHRQHRVNIKVVRIFNTYGPRMLLDDGRAISNFITQALQGHNITIYGNGQQTRSFCYVDDLVRGMLLMMDSGETGPINLGNPSEITVLELAEKIIHLIGSKSKIVFQTALQDDPKRRQPDISMAKSKLRWEPTVSLEDGLKQTITYFQGIMGHIDKSPTGS
jgi:UDP-glucuronate decarboxylase